jgi:hypothetical protein
MPPGAKALDIASSMYGLKAVPFKEIGVSAACLAPQVRFFKIPHVQSLGNGIEKPYLSGLSRLYPNNLRHG